MKKFIPHGKLHYDEGDTSFVHRELTVYHQEEDAIRFVKLILPATLEIDQFVRALMATQIPPVMATSNSPT